LGVQVRKVLLTNAAKHWNVPVAELTTGIAHLTNIFAIGSFVNELALKRGIDPAALRRDLLKGNSRAVNIIDTVSRIAD
jgi:hypothetical protein